MKFHGLPALVNQIEENIGQKNYFWRKICNFVVQILLFQINMDKFNYLQSLDNDNDLLAAELLLADYFPAHDVSCKQIVVECFPNVAAVPLVLESTGTKTKTTTTQRTRRSSRRFKISCDFKRGYRRAEVCVAVNKNTSCSSKQRKNVFNTWFSSRHLDINIEKMAPEKLDKLLSKFYAEVRKKDGDDYEPESLKIM